MSDPLRVVMEVAVTVEIHPMLRIDVGAMVGAAVKHGDARDACSCSGGRDASTLQFAGTVAETVDFQMKALFSYQTRSWLYARAIAPEVIRSTLPFRAKWPSLCDGLIRAIS
jgi:hypothetical protein